MLKALNIHKSYGDLHVLKGLDLQISKGEVISIIGTSGAGKSTFLHVLGTLDRPDKGTLELEGSDLFSLNDKVLAQVRNQSIGFVFQFHNLLPEFTALENICIPGFIARRNVREVKAKSREILKLLGLEARANHKPTQLSGGEQQRVSVARALINDPKIIFADEPSGNLDSKNAAILHSLFFKLRDELGQTFVIVTHNQEFADLADRKLEIFDGKIS